MLPRRSKQTCDLFCTEGASAPATAPARSEARMLCFCSCTPWRQQHEFMRTCSLSAVPDKMGHSWDTRMSRVCTGLLRAWQWPFPTAYSKGIAPQMQRSKLQTAPVASCLQGGRARGLLVAVLRTAELSLAPSNAQSCVGSVRASGHKRQWHVSTHHTQHAV